MLSSSLSPLLWAALCSMMHVTCTSRSWERDGTSVVGIWRRIRTCHSDAVNAQQDRSYQVTKETVASHAKTSVWPNDMGICNRRHFLLTICILQLVSVIERKMFYFPIKEIVIILWHAQFSFFLRWLIAWYSHEKIWLLERF